MNSRDYFNQDQTGRPIYCHQFGIGNGMSAELISLVLKYSRCRRHKIRFFLQKHSNPQGFAIQKGWEDYFLPTFKQIDLGPLGFLNRPMFPFNRLPLLRVIAGTLLRKVTSADYFMFDDLNKVGGGSNIEQEASDTWDDMSALIQKLMQFNKKTESEISSLVSKLELNEAYISVHIRRGDKINESQLVPVQNYVDTITSLNEKFPSTIFVATDDVQSFEELRSALGSKYQCVYLERSDQSGHNQRTFNSLDNNTRRRMTIEFLADLKIIFSSTLFIGSSTSNIFYLTRYYRANQAMIDVSNVK